MRIGNGGWARQDDPDLPGEIYVRFSLHDGRLKVVELYLSPDEPIDSTLLRGLKIGRIEAWANDPETRGIISDSLNTPGPDLRRLASYFSTSFGKRPSHWVAQSMAAQVEGSGVEQPPIVAGPVSGRGTRRKFARLNLPEGNRYPDSFYKQVSEIYGNLSQFTDRPVLEIAEANGVPATTAHRWIKEARRRGFLGPGRKGKTG